MNVVSDNGQQKGIILLGASLAVGGGGNSYNNAGIFRFSHPCTTQILKLQEFHVHYI